MPGPLGPGHRAFPFRLAIGSPKGGLRRHMRQTSRTGVRGVRMSTPQYVRKIALSSTRGMPSVDRAAPFARCDGVLRRTLACFAGGIGDGRCMREALLTFREIAALLTVAADKTVYVTAQRRELPGFKVHRQWGFKPADLDHWIEERKAAERKAARKGGKA